MNETQPLLPDVAQSLPTDPRPAALAPDPCLLHGEATVSRRVLVVDDHPLLRFALTDALIGQGYECYGAENGLAALAVLGTTQIDLVVTDLSMPQMGGMELLMRMGASPMTQSVPVVVVTAYLSEELRRQVLAAGAKAVVTRSVRPDEILAAVRTLLTETSAGSKPSLARTL